MNVYCFQLESDSRSGSSLSLRQMGVRQNNDTSNSGQSPQHGGGSSGGSKVTRSVSATNSQKTSRRYSTGGEGSGESIHA